MLSRQAISRRQLCGRMSTHALLPRLPVPDLRNTLDRYLQSLEPYMLEDPNTYKASRELRVKWANEFASGIGKVCQDRLLGP